MATHDPNDLALTLVEEQAEERIRREWHDGRWYCSVIDVIGVITDSPNPGVYWRVLKSRLKDEGSDETVTKCNRLKMRAADGKMRETDAADVETLLRIIQSVPSPKAEPVKQWLARVGAQRLEEATQPLPPPHGATLEQPAETAPALDWARYHEQMAALYRRQALYEAQLADLQGWRGHVESRLESHEASLALIPEILERLGPEMLSPAHQRRVQQSVKRLHEVGGAAYPTIYAELCDHFHVAKYDQLPEARWVEIAAWFSARIDAAERRAGRHGG